jgi:TolB protein
MRNTNPTPHRPRLAPIPLATLGLLGAWLLPATGTSQPDASTECFRELVTALAADDMEGRGVGTEGLERAATLITARFAAAGLDDGGVGHTQTFDVITGVSLGDGNALSWNDERFAVEADFVPLGFSASGAFEGEVVFAEPLGYDDYAGLDVTGRIVLALRYEPGESDEASPFDGRRPTRWSDLRYKAYLAREAGASALIFVTGPGADEPTEGGDTDEPERLPNVRSLGPTSHAGLPVLQVTRAVAERWLAAAGHDLRALQTAIDSSYAPHSVALPGVSLVGHVDVRPTLAPVRNVLGVWPGDGELAGEVVVVGAHYDHLGYGGSGSRAPDTHEIHNGADDNASGVAAMVCALEQLRATEAPEGGPRRTLLALAFTAEEIGLGGSGHYVDHPLFPLADTVAMVNLDMVGRVVDRRLSAIGTDTATEWVALLEPAAAAAGLALEMGGDGYGPSDQTPFYEAGVPVIHLFSGAHDEYHTPADDAETLNMSGGGQVTALLANLVATLVALPDRPTFQRADSGPLMAGDSRGYGAYLGSIPDYSAMMGSEGGVLLADVRAGGPADEAGLKGGDRIVGFAGRSIENLYDLTFALQDHRPGETVDVVVERDGARVTFAVTLRSRAPSSTVEGSPHGSPHGARQDAPQGDTDWAPAAGVDASHLLDPREVHLADLRQLTFGGENAEGYFSPDGRRLIFQRTPPEGGCDQQYVLDLDTGDVVQVSSGRGRTTCGYFSYPDGDRVIYSTTEHVSPDCPAPPDHSAGYVWALYDYDLVWQDGPEAAPVPFLPSPHYDAEATVCMVDGRVVFTSTRNGDLDLYVVDADGSNLRQLTDTPGYDGGAFFSPDCRSIVFRASRHEGDALADYQALLAQGLVRPGTLEIYVMDADGSNVRQLTSNGAANFGPYPLPDGSGAIYSSNAGGSIREFDLFVVRHDGGEPEQVTFTEQFDGFPMFSPDGRWLVFASNRGAERNQTNLFIARWVP